MNGNRIKKNVCIVKRITLMSLVLILLACSLDSFSQTLKPITKRMRFKEPEYLFNVGDTIVFFPFNPNYNGNYAKGYTCFYDSKCIEGGFKPKYRFKQDNSKMTPITEIENYYFCVKSINTRDFNKKNKLYYSAVLERISDHTEVCFDFLLK